MIDCVFVYSWQASPDKDEEEEDEEDEVDEEEEEEEVSLTIKCKSKLCIFTHCCWSEPGRLNLKFFFFNEPDDSEAVFTQVCWRNEISKEIWKWMR